MKKFFVLFLIFSFSFAVINKVEAGDEGTSGAIILSQPMGARASAMAEAYTAISGNIDCLYYNPAGIALLEKKQMSFTYQKGISDDNFGIINFGLPTKNGVFAGSLILYTAGDIELIDIFGNSRTVKSQEDYLAAFSYSRNLFKNVSIGLNAKVLHSTLVEDFSATAFAFDIGGLYKRKNFSLGLAVQNIGTKLKYEDEGDSLPMNIRTGISYRINDLSLGFDIIKPNDDDLKENIGMEYTIEKLFTLRAGYKIGYDLDSLTFGIGFNLKDFNIDYATAMKDDFDPTHKVSLTYNF